MKNAKPESVGGGKLFRTHGKFNFARRNCTRCKNAFDRKQQIVERKFCPFSYRKVDPQCAVRAKTSNSFFTQIEPENTPRDF